jgi:photosystem II stability/assembly factor-like uncharacterized protein
VRRLLAPLLLVLLATCAHRPETERQDDPDEAARYFALKRGITADLDLNARYAAAREHILGMPRMSVVAPIRVGRLRSEAVQAWQFLGPGNVGGRTRALLIDPNDSNVMYAAAVSGGVWKTTDGGASWTSITDFLPNIAVNCLAFDPADSRVVYAGTGEGYFREVIRGTNVPIRGNGIFVTRDAGATWAQFPSTAGQDFYWVNDVVVSTHDSQRLYAATRNGVFRSRDGGASWTRVVDPNVNGGCLDLAFRGDTANDFLFATCGMLQGQAAVYRSTNADGDGAWTSVLSEAGMGRTTLAIAPSDPSVVYALAARNGGTFDQGLFALFRSSQSGAAGTWVAQVRTATTTPTSYGQLLLTNLTSATNNECTSTKTTGLSNMGWHCNIVAVDPKDADRVWAAGVDLFRSDDGGRTWGVASFWSAPETAPSFVHADQHDIVFDPHYDGLGNQTMVVTNDGGVFRTDNARAPVSSRIVDYCTPSSSHVVFHSLNHDFGATQFYHGAVFPGGDRYLGGAQDNSTPIGSDAAGVNAWDVEVGGDGGYVAVDPVDPRVWYGESQFGGIVRMVGDRFDGFLGLPQGDFLFITPYLLDPNQHDRIWAGGGRTLLRRDAGRGYTPVSGLLDGHITALDVAPGNSNRIFLGSETGTIYRNNAALSATNITAWASTRPRDGWVSSLTFDPANTAVAYATYATFGGGAHVWKTSDAGVTWAPIDGTGAGALPDVPVHTLAVSPTSLYLGTDLGIFVSNDGGELWFAESSFPRAITEKLILANAANGPALFAFTHGRGAWRATLAEPPRRRAVR